MSGGTGSARYRLEGVVYPIVLPGYQPNGSPQRFSASFQQAGTRGVRIVGPQEQTYEADRVQFSAEGKRLMRLHSNRLDDWADIIARPATTHVLQEVDPGLWTGYLIPYDGRLEQATGLVACYVDNGATPDSERNRVPDNDVPTLLRTLATRGKIILPDGFPTQ
jgi:hypothetical protein